MNLDNALISMLTLELAMVVQFGEGQDATSSVALNITTGSIVVVSIIAVGIALIRRAGRKREGG